jgi:hypothetical protein
MASRKMTFSFPPELAATLIRRVPARDRSRYLAEALTEKLADRDRALIRACEAANADADILAIEQEFDQIDTPIEDPWDAPVRRSHGKKR